MCGINWAEGSERLWGCKAGSRAEYRLSVEAAVLGDGSNGCADVEGLILAVFWRVQAQVQVEVEVATGARLECGDVCTQRASGVRLSCVIAVARSSEAFGGCRASTLRPIGVRGEWELVGEVDAGLK